LLKLLFIVRMIFVRLINRLLASGFAATRRPDKSLARQTPMTADGIEMDTHFNA